MLYHVTMLVKTTMTLPIEAADADEAKEIALEMPVEEISDIVEIEALEIEKMITDVSEAGSLGADDPDPMNFERYEDQDEHEEFDGNL